MIVISRYFSGAGMISVPVDEESKLSTAQPIRRNPQADLFTVDSSGDLSKSEDLGVLNTARRTTARRSLSRCGLVDT